MMFRSHSTRMKSLHQRKAFATFLVLSVVVALSFVVYSYSNQVFLEHSAFRASVRQTELKLFAESGIQATMACSQGHTSSTFYRWVNSAKPWESALENKSGPSLIFQSADNGEPSRIGVYSWIDREVKRTGLISESAKLNINGLNLSKEAEVQSRVRLCAIPGITVQMADSLLDWIDPDNEPRTHGGEANSYRDTSSQFRPTNRSFRSLSELASVRGFSETLVFGEDFNRNGWLDWNENDGASSFPFDNQDGKLDLGLSRYLTTVGAESIMDFQNRPKIFLNDTNLASLHSQIEARLGREAADFVAAYRLDGPMLDASQFEGRDFLKERRRDFDARIKNQLEGESQQPTRSGSTIQSSKKGLRLNSSPIIPIESILDLLDVSVVTMIDQEEKILTSPWQRSKTDIHDLITLLDGNLSTVKGTSRSDRIDINHAPLEVLLTIPNLSHSAADAIINHRQMNAERMSGPEYRSIHWLVANRILTWRELKEVSPFMTTTGSVYSGYSVGHDLRNSTAAIVGFTLSFEGTTVRLLDRWEVGFTRLRP